MLTKEKKLTSCFNK